MEEDGDALAVIGDLDMVGKEFMKFVSFLFGVGGKRLSLGCIGVKGPMVLVEP